MIRNFARNAVDPGRGTTNMTAPPGVRC